MRSKLIVMPGSRRADPDLADVDLIGHVLTLNPALCKKFQCGGFSVGPAHLSAVVTPGTQLGPIRQAIQEGKLVDITKNATKGITSEGGSASAITEEDTGKKVYLGTDSRGNTYVVAPSSRKEQRSIERQIKKTGTIAGDYELAGSESFSGLSTIYEEPIERECVVLTDANGKVTPSSKAPESALNATCKR